MEDKTKYHFTTSQTEKNIIFSVTDEFMPTDNTELVDKRADKIAQLAINNVEDWEKSRYELKCNTSDSDSDSTGCLDIYLHLFKFTPAQGPTLDWIDAGMFTELDILTKSNRLVSSFFRVSYYTTPHRETQKLIGYSTIQVEVSNTSKFSICPNQPGSFLYHWKSKRKLNMSDNKLYMKVEFFNSANGKVMTLGAAIPVFPYTPEFYIDFWNEKMDYTVISLDDKTRTFTMQPKTWDFEALDWFGAGSDPATLNNYLKVRSYNIGCSMDLYYKELITCPPYICG
tara:strand:+ start:18670 stop:19521 length:852 start_codon:yes stop_codon:yes gene_type:complete